MNKNFLKTLEQNSIWSEELHKLGRDFGINYNDIENIIADTKNKFVDSNGKETYILITGNNPEWVIEKNNIYNELISIISSPNDFETINKLVSTISSKEFKNFSEVKEYIKKLSETLNSYKNKTAYNLGHIKLKKLIFKKLES